MSALLELGISGNVSPESARPWLVALNSTAVSPAEISIRSLRSGFLNLISSDFDITIKGLVNSVLFNESLKTILLKVGLGDGIQADIGLIGALSDRNKTIEIHEVSCQIAPTEATAQVEFIASTLNAAFALSRRTLLQISNAGLELELRFHMPLLQSSLLLQSRRTSYMIMCIERATGIHFELPSEGFSGRDIDAINFVFRSIVERRFVYHWNEIAMPIEATPEGLSALRSIEKSQELAIEPEPLSRKLLGRDVSLGLTRVTILDPVIRNVELARTELENGNVETVDVIVRSRINQARYELPDAPRLDPMAWPPDIQKLINIEAKLDSVLFDKYNLLATETLEGLTDEEKRAATDRADVVYPRD